ncbi:MAG: carboxymuconolactone decarboxylase family protein, partial [Phycisphaerales bacterium]
MINGYTLERPNPTPEQQAIFEKATVGFGFVPNIIAAFAESPVLADAMLDLYSRFGDTSFDHTESHVVLQTINVLNGCTYCVPAHSTGARSRGVDTAVDNALRDNQPLDNPKLEALRTFTAQMIKQRGHLSAEQFDALINAGYTKQTALDVVFLITVKTLTNYGNHITGTDLDEVF